MCVSRWLCFLGSFYVACMKSKVDPAGFLDLLVDYWFYGAMGVEAFVAV